MLTIGRILVVASLLLKAESEGSHSSGVVLEGRPDAAGSKVTKLYANAGIPTTVVLDSTVGYMMERDDLVVVGSEGVVQNGSIFNMMGTYAMGIASRELVKPCYVAADSYKFSKDVPAEPVGPDQDGTGE